MSTLAPFVLAFMVLPGSQTPNATEPPSQSATRIIEGRVTDGQGRPVHEGKVMFAPQDPPLPFSERATAAIDAQGHYRIEISTFPYGDRPIPASGVLRYLVLVPGFRSGAGRVAAEPASAKIDVQLTPEEWKPTEILLVDRDGKPVPGAEVKLMMGGSAVWSRHTSDAKGRCLVKSCARPSLRDLGQARRVSARAVWHGGDAGQSNTHRGPAVSHYRRPCRGPGW